MPATPNPNTPGLQTMLFAPTITTTELSEQEKLMMVKLAGQLMDPDYQQQMQISEQYYLGINVVASLGISVPPELEPLRAILGWCASGIDARTERLNVTGFRLPGQTEVDEFLQQTWQENDLDAESNLAHNAALVAGRAYGVVATDPKQKTPLISIEPPTAVIGSHDLRARGLSAAFRTYLDTDPASETYNRQLATLWHRDATIHLAQDKNWQWTVQDRDDHRLGAVPVVQFAPRATLTNRLGRSEMSWAWRNTQDRACRNLVRMEVTGEFYATMKIFLLGVTEEQFKKPDGTIASAWETFIGRISTLAADAYGNLPQISTIPGQSPDGFATTLDLDRSLMAGHTGLAPQYLGIFSDGNPASADAIRMSDFRLKTIADQLSVSLGNSWEALMRIALTVAGETRDGAEQLETDWTYTGIPTPYSDTQSMAQQITAGMIPPTADDALAKVGWTPVQRKRLAAERERAAGLAALDSALNGLLNPNPAPGQPADGQQPQALTALHAKRSTDGGLAG